MDVSVFCRFNSKSCLNCCLCVLRTRTRTRPRWATPVTLWRTVLLLLSFLSFSCCLEEDCELGIVGHPVSLPCLYPELSTFKKVSIEWRREGEVVLRSVWEGDRNVEECSVNNATVSADALLTGNLSLELPTFDLKEDRTVYSLFVSSGENQSSLLCAVCLKTAASFSPPLLHREHAHGQTAYICRSSGGFPEPAVYWLINDTEEPPESAVRTLTASHPDSHLYNITSHLTVNNYNVSSVSCIVENQSMNETLTSTSYGPRGSKAVKRASEAMWVFSTALCVVVGVMVMAAVGYQIHLDRMSKKKKTEYQKSMRRYERRCPNDVETEVMETEPKDTDV